MTTDKQLALTDEDVRDAAAEFYFAAKFSELLAFAQVYDVPQFWTKKAAEVSRALVTMELDEQLFIQYVDFLSETCTLEVIRNTYLLNTDPRDSSVIVQITVSKKHITEGGRVAEALSVLNMEIFNRFSAEELKALSCAGYAILVDTYDEDDFYADEEDDEDEHADEADYDPECDCHYCEAYRTKQAEEILKDIDEENSAVPEEVVIPSKKQLH